jgi:hypothetical protein
MMTRTALFALVMTLQSCWVSAVEPSWQVYADPSDAGLVLLKGITDFDPSSRRAYIELSDLTVDESSNYTRDDAAALSELACSSSLSVEQRFKAAELSHAINEDLFLGDFMTLVESVTGVDADLAAESDVIQLSRIALDGKDPAQSEAARVIVETLLLPAAARLQEVRQPSYRNSILAVSVLDRLYLLEQARSIVQEACRTFDDDDGDRIEAVLVCLRSPTWNGQDHADEEVRAFVVGCLERDEPSIQSLAIDVLRNIHHWSARDEIERLASDAHAKGPVAAAAKRYKDAMESAE